MREKIDCFLPCHDFEDLRSTVSDLMENNTTRHVHLLVGSDFNDTLLPEDIDCIYTSSPFSTQTIKEMAEHTDADFVMISTKSTPVEFGEHALERLLRVAADSDAAMVYCDHYSMIDGIKEKHPVTDYQKGSIRDDFDFGQIILLPALYLHEYASTGIN